MANIKGWTLKNVKKWEGREGEGIQGDLYFAGKKVGWYNDAGNGGETDIDLYTPRLYEMFKNAAKAYFEEHPDPLYQALGIKPDEDNLIEEILTLIEREKLFKKYIKQGYQFLLIIDDGLSWSHMGIKNEESLIKLQHHIEEREKKKVIVYKSLNDFNL